MAIDADYDDGAVKAARRESITLTVNDHADIDIVDDDGAVKAA